MTLPQFTPTASVPLLSVSGGLLGAGGFPEPLSFPFGSTGMRVFASPTCQRLFRLPSRKIHANRTRGHSSCVFSAVRHDGSVGRRFPSFH
jgi:hypothetical protein